MKTILLATTLSLLACVARAQEVPPATPPAETVKKARPAAWLGVSLESEDGKIVVKGVFPGSPAQQAGLQAGDVIVSLGDTKPGGDRQLFMDGIAKRQPGEKVELRWSRNGQDQSGTVALGERPQEPGLEFRGEFHRAPEIGEVKELKAPKETKEKAQEKPKPAKDRGGFLGVGLEVNASGALVMAFVSPDSPAAKAGLVSGDVVLEFEGVVFSGDNVIQRFRKAVAAKKPGQEVTIRYQRGTDVATAKVTIGEHPAPEPDPAWMHRPKALAEILPRSVPDKKVEELLKKEMAKVHPVPGAKVRPLPGGQTPPAPGQIRKLAPEVPRHPGGRDVAGAEKLLRFYLDRPWPGERANAGKPAPDAAKLEDLIWKQVRAAVSRALKDAGAAEETQKQVMDAISAAQKKTSDLEARHQKLEQEAARLEKEMKALKAQADQLKKELEAVRE